MEIKIIDRSQTNLVVDLFDQYRVFYKQASDLQRARDFLQERLDHNESVIFVAFMRDEHKITPVGFTQLYPVYSSVRTTKNWLLNDLYVTAAYRKQRIGEKLIRTAIAFAKDSHAKYVYLSTAVDNYTAQSLYEAVGFERQKADTEFYDYRIMVS